MKLTKSQKLINAFRRGDQLSLAQIRSRFGLLDPKVTLSDLRLRYGCPTKKIVCVDSKGRVVEKYQLDAVPDYIVALGYRLQYELSKKNPKRVDEIRHYITMGG